MSEDPAELSTQPTPSTQARATPQWRQTAVDVSCTWSTYQVFTTSACWWRVHVSRGDGHVRRGPTSGASSTPRGLSNAAVSDPRHRRRSISLDRVRFPGLGTEELACRPGSVPVRSCDRSGGDHPSRPAVAGGLVRSTHVLGRAALGRTCAGGPDISAEAAGFLTLLRAGFAEPAGSPRSLVVSCTTVSPLPTCAGGLFSVALSRGSPRVGVAHRPALRSPDLPRRPSHDVRRGRPASSSARSG